MRIVIVFISFLFLQNMQGKGFENYLLLLKEGGISIYDLYKEDSLLTISLTGTGKWNIGKVTKDGEVLNILLHDDEKYIGSNFDKSINEKEFSINLNDLDILFSKERTIIQRDNGLFIEKGDVKLEERSLYERYLDTNKYLSEEGDLYSQGNKKVLFLRGNIENKVLCGYYQPDVSNDGERIVCEYRCSKYNGKKQIGKSQITEIEVETKRINKMQLFGYNPTYSEDGRMILYNNTDGCNLYFKDTGKSLHLERVYQAIWIK